MSGSIPYQNRITKQYFNWQQPERKYKMENTNVTVNVENELNYDVCINRTPEFFQAAQTLSDFIKDLPIDQPTNDQLVALMVEQVKVAEHDALLQGFEMGVLFALKKQRVQMNSSGTES